MGKKYTARSPSCHELHSSDWPPLSHQRIINKSGQNYLSFGFIFVSIYVEKNLYAIDFVSQVTDNVQCLFIISCTFRTQV